MYLTFASRPSALALWQTRWVMQSLQAIYPNLICAESVIHTRGDKVLGRPLPEIGGKGLFTTELEAELSSGQVDVAVHSLKDLPVESAPGLTIGAIPVRGEVRDVLISPAGYTLETLPEGARVGTSSLRRAAQVLSLRPDVNITPLRGNVDTRIRKVSENQCEAAILAGAGLMRLGLTEYISQWLPLEQFLPAPGQGALATQCRADDERTLSLLSSIDDSVTRASTAAERQFLSHLGGGCAIPVGAFGQIAAGEENLLHLDGLVASIDGVRVVRVSAEGVHPTTLGTSLAEKALSDGAAEILEGLSKGH